MKDGIEKMVDHLRSEHRIKHMVDYAYTIGNGIDFLCHDTYVDDLIEHCRVFGITITTLSIIGRRGWPKT